VKTKSGEPIPEDLAQALEAEPGMLAKWEKLKPSCQRGHVERVVSAKKPETRQRRVSAVLRMASEWYERHYGPVATSASSGRRRG
jgi:uncharacterized protein YdeI (YjbR/CyaY-like superfamily)